MRQFSLGILPRHHLQAVAFDLAGMAAAAKLYIALLRPGQQDQRPQLASGGRAVCQGRIGASGAVRFLIQVSRLGFHARVAVYGVPMPNVPSGPLLFVIGTPYTVTLNGVEYLASKQSAGFGLFLIF